MRLKKVFAGALAAAMLVCAVAVPAFAAEEVEQENCLTSSYVQMNIPYADFYKAAGVDNASEIDAVTSATRNKSPAYYITAWYNLLSSKWEFGKVHATETTVEGTTVELNTNGHHATYEMKLSGFDLDYKTNKVYGVVLTTADGSEYGLHHVANIWHGTKLGFNADDPYFASIIGKTITQITFYAADGVYVLPVNVAL